MTIIAQGLLKQVNVVKQASLGVLGTTGSVTMRRKTGVGQATRDSFKSTEIVSHHQSTGISLGLKKVSYKLDGELSAKTYDVFIAAMCEVAAAAGGTGTVGTDCTSQAADPQFVDASAAWITNGFKIGDVVQFGGFTTTAAGNNARNFWITGLTSTNMTGQFLDGTVVLAKGPETGSVTCAIVGKKYIPPLTGHTKDYITIEDWYSDVTKSDLFGDLVVQSMDFDLPASGNAAFSCSMVGTSRTAGSSQTCGTPAASTTTGIMASINGKVSVAGVSTLITALKISLANAAAATPAEVGSNVSGDVSRGVIEVSGSFSANLRDNVITALYEAETEILVSAVLPADATPISDFMAFTMSKVRMTGDAPTDGVTGITRTYPFVARINTAGGAATAYDQSIISIQDSAAV